MRPVGAQVELTLAPEQLDVQHPLKLSGIDFLRPDFRVRPDNDVRATEAIPPEALGGRYAQSRKGGFDGGEDGGPLGAEGPNDLSCDQMSSTKRST